MQKILIIILALLDISSYAQSEINVSNLRKANIDVYFGFGEYTLSNAAKHTIDSLITHQILTKNRRVGIIGYADIIGGEKNNKALSEKRANAVAEYLRKTGIDSRLIEQVTGMGEINRPDKAEGYPEDRKVSLVPGGFDDVEKMEWGKDGMLIANLRFKYTTTEYYPYVTRKLDTILYILKNNPQLVINIDGYVCCFNYDSLSVRAYINLEGKRFKDTARLGGAERLSMARAKIIANYLTSHGILAGRIKCRSFGYLKNKMLDDGTSKHGYDRVEIRVINKNNRLLKQDFFYE